MIKLFSGSANPILSKKVADLAGIKIAKSEVVRFDNSEVRVRIEEDVRDQTCAVIQPTSNPTDTHLMELLFFCDALKRSEAKKVTAIIPYFGYARQNKQHRSGEDVSANVVVKMLEIIGFNEIITFDIHDEGMEGIFTVPYKNLSALPLLADQIKKELGGLESVAVVSPDQGGVERARNFADSFFDTKGNPIVVIEKRRNLERIQESQAIDLYGEVEDKIVVIVDDIVTSGGTLINAVNLCISKGAKKAYAAIVHHDFSKEASKLLQDSRLEKFYTTDTILLDKEQNFPKLQEISVANLIARELNI